MKTHTTRALPWAVVVLTVGVLTGFVFGETRTPPSADAEQQVAAPPTTLPTEEAVPRAVSQLPCVGGPTETAAYRAVFGVTDVHAEQLAQEMDLQVDARSFAQISQPEEQEQLTAAAVQSARQGPVILVLKLSDGPYQRRLAQDVTAASPRSVAVVVTEPGQPVATGPADFPDRSLAVAAPSTPEPHEVQTWAAEVAAVLTGATTCPGG